MKNFLRTAAVSVPIRLGDAAHNAQTIVSALDALRQQGVQLALFPELCLTGATLGDLFFRPDVLTRARGALEAVAARTQGIAAVVGLPAEVNGRLCSCAAVLQNGSVRAIVPRPIPKQEQRRWFSEGTQSPLFSLGGCVFSIWQAHSAAQAVLLPDAAPAHQPAEITSRLTAAVYANAGFGESTGDHVYAGDTAVYEDGVCLAQGGRYALAGGHAVADIDLQAIAYRRRMAGWTADAADCIALDDPLPIQPPLLRPISCLPFVTGDAEEIAMRQTMGLVSRLHAISCKKLVVGVSGGLDSTLALLIAVRAFDRLGLDRKGIFAITMPGGATGARTYSNACQLMQLLGVTALEIPIGAAVSQHFADIGHDPNAGDVTCENAQARERTQILMDYANKVGGIVLGTGDMSELALGFCTYNGDHMSMYGVNASIPKTLVRKLTDHVSAQMGDVIHAVCADVIATPVSPELLPGQRTEDILGSYELHDFFLYHFLHDGADRERLLMLAAQAFPGEAVKPALNIFLRRFQTQQFTRSCLPDGAQAGPLSLSPRDAFVMPSYCAKL